MIFPIVAIADAVRSHIAGLPLSQPSTVVREYIPRHDLGSMTQARISVVPFDVLIENLSRGQVDVTYDVRVGFAKMVGHNNWPATDQMVQLMDDVARGLLATLNRKLPTYPGPMLIAPPVVPQLYDRDELRKAGVFIGVIVLKYKLADDT